MSAFLTLWLSSSLLTAAPEAGLFLAAGEARPHGWTGPTLTEFAVGSPPPEGPVLLAGVDNPDPDLLGALAAQSRVVVLIINGLGDHALRALTDNVAGTVILAFDARPITDWRILKQLGWLNAQRRPFAVIVDNADALEMAAAFAPAHLIMTGNDMPRLGRLHSIAAALAPGRPRPLGFEEVDALAGREACLTVTAPLAAGDMLHVDLLAVSPTASRGISPHLRGRVAGRKLRYPIAPGEPLTFGHFGDSKRK